MGCRNCFYGDDRPVPKMKPTTAAKESTVSGLSEGLELSYHG